MVRSRTLPFALVLIALLVPEGAAAESATRIIVKRAPGLTAAERADVRADAGVRLVDTLRLPRTEVVSAPAGDAQEALRELRDDDDVVYAELDSRRQAFPDDPFFEELWGLENIGAEVDWFGFGTDDADMDVTEAEAWSLSTGAGQIVAVVDSGIDASHPDLAAQILPGHDWVDDDTTPDDANGHGTHVSGTIAAQRNNTEGVAGIAPDAKIVPLRVLAANGSGFTSDVVDAFDYAGDQGIRIVNASLGSEDFSSTERAAIAAHPQTLYVVAAGNGGDDDVGDNVDATPTYPCAYNLANVLCVGASNPDDEPASFSNFGAVSVDVFAPGVSIFSTYPVDGNGCDLYCFSDGTSMASPHVAGEAALLRALDPSLSAAAIKAAIMDSADTTALLTGKAVTGARANAYMALVDSTADTDSDGVVDIMDNCDTAANPTQTNVDSDAQGDACDATPRGPDADGDGKPAVDDVCPNLYGTGADGCPVAVPMDRDGDGRLDISDACPLEGAATLDGCPLPAFAALSAKVKRCGTGRCVTVRVHTSRIATVRVTIDRRRCSRGRCRWVRVMRKTVSTSRNVATVRSARLARGTYRAVVLLSSSAGRAKPETVRFRVR
jgi:subtilisin family serine protease